MGERSDGTGGGGLHGLGGGGDDAVTKTSDDILGELLECDVVDVELPL